MWEKNSNQLNFRPKNQNYFVFSVAPIANMKVSASDDLPLKTMLILCIVILSEPLSMTILFPFVVFMIRDFNIEEANIGYFVGFVASSFSLAQLLTSAGWGALSDRIGRRPVLLMGLFGNAITMISFGLSKSLVWCLISRFCCGMLNGNIG